MITDRDECTRILHPNESEEEVPRPRPHLALAPPVFEDTVDFLSFEDRKSATH